VTPGNVARLAPAWTADAGPGSVAGVATTTDELLVSGADGLFAYPLPCTVSAQRTCTPLWEGRIPDGPLSVPTTNGDVVYAGSAAGRLYAYPTHCDTAQCRPLWTGEAGHGPVSAPGVNDDFVYVTAGKLFAYPAECGTGNRVCPPAWVGQLPAQRVTGRPAVGSGLVVVSGGSPRGGVAAFPAVCLDPCKPVWTAETGGPATAVTVSEDTAFVVARGKLMAFPLACKGACRPTWVGTIVTGRPPDPGAIGAPTLGAGQVFVGGADGRLLSFPDACATTACSPQHVWSLGVLPLGTPIVQDNVVYVVTQGGVVMAIPLGCDGASPGCDAPWSEPLGTTAAGSPPAATGDGLYVGDDAGMVHAFTVPTGGA
jgi:PQQ-like domain